MPIERHGEADTNEEEAESKFKVAVREALERALLQSELRDATHGVRLISVGNSSELISGGKYVLADFHVQLSSDPGSNRLPVVLLDALRATNFSLGGTEIIAARDLLHELQVEGWYSWSIMES